VSGVIAIIPEGIYGIYRFSHFSLLVGKVMGKIKGKGKGIVEEGT
jgi:hypothetical protein